MADENAQFSEQFELKEELGKGAFSVVKKAVLKSNKAVYAAKIINTKKLSARDQQKLEREVRICRSLHHVNIVRLHYVFTENHVFYMLFDLITGGELFDDIVAREFYSEKDASHCIQQIFEGVQHCHHMGIIHRDIKPENLLLSSKDKSAVVKLADFGLSVEATENKCYYGFAGTPGYLAPEVISKEPYSKPVDLWGCGVVLYILLVGYPPFWDEDQGKLFDQIRKGRYEYPSPEWDSVTPAAKELIDGLLDRNQDTRLTAEAALSSQWIKNRDRVASAVHRQDTIAGLKSFNARRKLKAIMQAARLVAKNSLLHIPQQAESPTHPESSHPLPEVEEMEEADIPQNAIKEEIIHLTNRLLTSILEKDFTEYQKLVTSDVTCFEPEGGSQLVTGIAFHKFYFDNAPSSGPTQQSMLHPHVRVLSDTAACIAYTRVIHNVDQHGVPYTSSFLETRVWQKIEKDWKCVHFHRSPPSSTLQKSI